MAEKKLRQQATIPSEWLLTDLPPKDMLNITHIPESSGLLSSKEIEITNTIVDVLLEKLANGSWSSVEVTTAFSKRAVIAHQLVSFGVQTPKTFVNLGQTNCLTEIFIDRALARAAQLDQHLKMTGQVVGPLHGILIFGC